MKPPAFRNIRRMDDDSRSTHAWLVQVQRHQRVDLKVFTDNVWGGKRKALAAARQWRDQLTLPADEYTHEMWRRNRLRRNNSSGMVGVARYERPPRPDGKPGGVAFWFSAWIDEHGVRRSRKFSVNRWGERGAKQRAIDEREREVARCVAARTTASVG